MTRTVRRRLDRRIALQLARRGRARRRRPLGCPAHGRPRGARLVAALGVVLLLLGLVPFPGAATVGSRLRDIARIRGVRDNQLVGYGLVVGLTGTGDKSGAGFTSTSVSTMLEGMGITVPADDIRVKNAAGVVVTATLPGLLKPGNRIDVTVSSLGDAKSLKGGILVQTPLRGADGHVYAVAQGAISLGGFGAEGPGGSSATTNHLTVGRIPDGALVERQVESTFVREGSFEITLRRPDFTTAQRVVEAVDAVWGPHTARAHDAATIEVIAPDSTLRGTVEFLARVENLTVLPAERARVVINERTGTIVAGGQVIIHPVAISHGNLNIRVEAATGVSQPLPYSMGETAYVTDSQIQTASGGGQFTVLSQGTTLNEIASALNAIGVSSRDMIAIFQAIKEAGALQAELVVL
ncbi:MAG: flagellar basal body P-ring protein FlgI [Candidatus Eisenbacteria sp.]|nr:flagellar basal body P-ring protein FlgI [Candidatus Eisenbacteria bacterium]